MSDRFTIVKGRYKDTPANRKKGIVGKVYNRKVFKRGVNQRNGGLVSIPFAGTSTPMSDPGMIFDYPKKRGGAVGNRKVFAPNAAEYFRIMKEAQDKGAIEKAMKLLGKSKATNGKLGGLARLPFAGALTPTQKAALRLIKKK